jgi:hypothetical protein
MGTASEGQVDVLYRQIGQLKVSDSASRSPGYLSAEAARPGIAALVSH